MTTMMMSRISTKTPPHSCIMHCRLCIYKHFFKAVVYHDEDHHDQDNNNEDVDDDDGDKDIGTKPLVG